MSSENVEIVRRVFEASARHDRVGPKVACWDAYWDRAEAIRALGWTSRHYL